MVASILTRPDSGVASGQGKEREAGDDLAAGRATHYESVEDFLTALDERLKPLDADP